MQTDPPQSHTPLLNPSLDPLEDFLIENPVKTALKRNGHPSRPQKRFIHFWGTRGSNPVSGPAYLKFGGNTLSIEIKWEEEHIIFDAGTGLRELGSHLMLGESRNLHLFLSHTHWDHIMGLPFFAPLYQKDYHIHLYGAPKQEKSLEEQISHLFHSDFFPVALEDLQATLSFHDLQPGERVEIGQVSVESALCNHPGGALGFKLSGPDKSFGYAPDNELFKGFHGHPLHLILEDYPQEMELLDFFGDCDLLIHEAQYTPQEYLNKVNWGHSSLSNATAFIKESRIKEWITIHHDPADTDEMLLEKLALHQTLLDQCDIMTPVSLSYDGLIYPF
ncbi:MAG: response regulator receiver protein [Chlamydiales bacterium]|jgi:phosphoribosyl 1,2-cyclic phosphodiesterase|nr:response regulator receiver protein [Chlamydiales bacterium]